MNRHIALALGITACAPDLTEKFIGEWTVAEGSYRDECPPPALSGDTRHAPGDTSLLIAAIDQQTLTVKLSFHSPSDPSSPSCEFSATNQDSNAANLQAKACLVASSRHDVLEGELRITPSGALLLDYSAVVGSKVVCQRRDSATFVPK